MRTKKIKKVVSYCVVLALLFCCVFSFDRIEVLAAEMGSVANGAIFRLKNVASGKYLMSPKDTDTNGANFYQYAYDGAVVEQRLLFSYSPTGDWYRIYSMGSSEGTNRCLSISGTVTSGANVQLYTPTVPAAQRFVLRNAGAQCVYIHLYGNENLVVGSYGTANGSSSGTSSTSAGNVCMQTYSAGNNNQKWFLEPFDATQAIPSGQYYIKNVNSNRYLTVSGVNTVQKAKTGASTQKWNVVYTGYGFYYLEPASDFNYLLDVANTVDQDGVNVGIHQRGSPTNPAQRYAIIPSGNNAFRIAPRCSTSRVLEVAGSSTAENANVQIREYADVNNQKWTFELIDEIDPYGIFDFEWVFSNNQYTRISSGYRTASRPNHYGMDISDTGIAGKQILFPTMGEIKNRTYNSKGGNMVVLETYWLDPNEKPIFVNFLHMQSPSGVSKGDFVLAGDLVGLVGDTGDSDGTHLHLSTYNGPNDRSSYDWAGPNTAINPQRFYPNISFTGNTSTTIP